MAYKLNVTEHADELLDNLVYHLIYRLKSECCKCSWNFPPVGKLSK